MLYQYHYISQCSCEEEHILPVKAMADPAS